MIDMGGFKDAPKSAEDGEGDGAGKAQEMASLEAMKAALEQRIKENQN